MRVKLPGWRVFFRSFCAGEWLVLKDGTDRTVLNIAFWIILIGGIFWW